MAIQARTVRRTITNENDDVGTTRLTRAKAKLAVGSTDASIAVLKKPLAAKKNATNAVVNNENAISRKRPALSDMSNGGKDLDMKKPLSTAVNAKPTISELQKATRTASTRSILGSKDKNSTGSDLKRPASVNGHTAPPSKKRATTSVRRSIKAEDDLEENIEPINDNVKIKVSQSVKVISKGADGIEVEREIRKNEKIIETKAKTEEDIRNAELIEAMDDEDHGDPLMVSEYVYDILNYMKELELKTMPNPNYIDQQKELQWRMRGVLIDWLLEVHTRFHLLPETFYLTVNIIDRFLSCKVVQLERLQLVGITAMFIASKYEEVLSPHVGNFRHVADDGFSEQEILSAERYILATLNYDLSFPNPMHFMRRISKADNYDIQTRTLAKYLLEITLLDHRFLAFRPSINAAASMHLARVILEKGEWVSY